MKGTNTAITASDLAARIGAEVIGDGSVVLRGFAPADRAQHGDLTFAENESYFARAEQSAASAIIVDSRGKASRKVLLAVPNARVAFAKVLPLFFPDPRFEPGIDPSAIVRPGAQVDPSAHIGPNCVVGEGARIRARAVLQGGNYIGACSTLGADVNLFPNVVIYPSTEIGERVRIHSGSVIGADGFGYVLDGDSHRKVPQIGNVIIRDDVEIGANVTIDRGALGPTIIGKGTKIDNLVQIGHNVTIGEHCLIVSQTGIAGSTKIGNFAILAGQTGVAGHLKIGNRVSLAAQSGLMHNIPDGQKWMGSPAQPDRQAKRQFIALQQLPDLIRRVAELEKKLEIGSETPPASSET